MEVCTRCTHVSHVTSTRWMCFDCGVPTWRMQMSEAVLAKRPAVFDGTGMAPREQFDAWREAVNTAFVPLDATPRNVDEFHGRLIHQDLGGMQLCEVAG